MTRAAIAYQTSIPGFYGLGDRRLWRLDLSGADPDASSGEYSRLLAISQDFSAGRYSTITVFLTPDSKVSDVFAILSISKCLVSLRPRAKGEPQPIECNASATEWVSASFWFDLQATHDLVFDVSRAEISWQRSELLRVARLLAKHRAVSPDTLLESTIQVAVTKLTARMIKFHLSRLDRESALSSLRSRARRSTLAYNWLCSDPVFKTVRMRALDLEPYFIGLALCIVRHPNLSPVLSSPDVWVTHLAKAPVRWKDFAWQLLDAVKCNQPLRDVVRSHTGLSRQDIRYFNSLGVQETYIFEHRRIERHIVDALPLESRPRSSRVVMELSPLLRYMETIEGSYFDLSTATGISHAELVVLQRHFLQTWKNHSRNIVRQYGWSTYPTESSSDLSMARGFLNEAAKVRQPLVAARVHLPNQSVHLHSALSTMSFRRRLKFHSDWNRRLAHLDRSFAAAELVAPRLTHLYKYQPVLGADIPVPVRISKVCELANNFGCQIQFLDSVAALDSTAVSFHNCLRTFGCHAMDLLSLKSALVLIISGSGQSLMELDLSGRVLFIHQHRGPRNVEPADENRAIGVAVYNLVDEFMADSRREDWLLEARRIEPCISSLVKEMFHEIEARETERVFRDWRLIDSPETGSKAGVYRLSMEEHGTAGEIRSVIFGSNSAALNQVQG